MSLDFRPLASSSAGCAYHLSGGGASRPLLIDCGLRFVEIRRALSYQTALLEGCLISHAHGDHIKAAPDLMRSGVDCYASAETWRSAPFVDPTHHRAKVCRGREQFELGEWRVMPFEAVHDMPGTLGFLVGSPDGSRLLYLTDSAYSPFKFDGLTHIAIEANFSTEMMKQNTREGEIHADRFKRTMKTHMSIERLIDMLRANDLSKVEEIHLLHLSSQNSDAEEFKRLVQRATGKPVYVAAERSLNQPQEAF